MQVLAAWNLAHDRLSFLFFFSLFFFFWALGAWALRRALYEQAV